jgi:hypothetical protein
MADIHDRMPLILGPRLLCRYSDRPDPRDLMRPFPAEPMRTWPISTRVNKPENDDPSIVEPVELANSACFVKLLQFRNSLRCVAHPDCALGVAGFPSPRVSRRRLFLNCLTYRAKRRLSRRTIRDEKQHILYDVILGRLKDATRH